MPDFTTRRARCFAVAVVFCMSLVSVPFSNFCEAARLANTQLDQDTVRLNVVWSHDGAKPGQELVLAVVLDVEQGYHIGNSIEWIPSDKRNEVKSTSVTLSLADATSKVAAIGNARFPKPKPSNPNPSQIDGETTVYIPVRFADDLKPEEISFELSVDYLACDNEKCLRPRTIKRSLKLDCKSPSAVTAGCSDPALFGRWNLERYEEPGKVVGQDKSSQDTKSKQPPIGPPWVRDLATAQEIALKSGLPIFVYSTKTYCPHCVVVEREMLSSPNMKKYYSSAVWLYIYRDFSSSVEDQKAERTAMRLSLSSWPQHFFIDPSDFSKIADSLRQVETFARAVEPISLEPTSDLTAVDQLRQSEARVVAFNAEPDLVSAKELLQVGDPVAKWAAVRFLVTKENWNLIVNHASDLLATQNDLVRIDVLNAIAKRGDVDVDVDVDLVNEIERLVVDPQPTTNPKMIQSVAINALGVCGNANSVDVIAPFAAGSALYLGKTRAVESLGLLVERFPERKEAVIEILKNSFPPIESHGMSYVLRGAKVIHILLGELTGEDVDFPAEYTESARSKLIKDWSDVGK